MSKCQDLVGDREDHLILAKLESKKVFGLVFHDRDRPMHNPISILGPFGLHIKYCFHVLTFVSMSETYLLCLVSVFLANHMAAA